MLAGNLLLVLSFLFAPISAIQPRKLLPLPTQIAHGTAAPEEPFWLEAIRHQGSSPFNSNSTYQVFRNVKDYGAKGDGIIDDTEAINYAISSGGRCGGHSSDCHSSTITPALIYFPAGVYLVSAPILAYYYSQLIGDAKNPPTLLAAADFQGAAVIDADPYIFGGNGNQWYGNTNNFFRSVRNFVIDLRRIPPQNPAVGLHWQVAQATSLINIVVEMTVHPDTTHQGLMMENGSGGFMGDLIFNGGKQGMWVGNQQFTVRNITINNALTGVANHWNWGWTFQGVTINNCEVGFDLGGDAGAVAIIDAMVNDTPIFVRSESSSADALKGSIVLSNVKLHNVPTAVGVIGGGVVLSGGTQTYIKSWGQGNIYSGSDAGGRFIQDTLPTPHKPSILLDSAGRIFGKMHPQYPDYSISQFVSVKDHGANGDGKTDDTKIIQHILRKYADKKIIFFDAGTYILTSTLYIPAGSRIVGEAWAVIAGSGAAFQNQDSPQPVVKVGDVGSCGVVEITDVIFSTIGPAAGAIVVEWNVREPEGQQGAAGMWDSHIRLGGSTGTNLELASCPPGSQNIDTCTAAFLALHLTDGSSAYLEGTWVWLADHDLDGDGSSQISLYSGRGILSESKGPVWMIGTAEHHVIYQYRLVHARNHYMGLIQTESPYWQPSPGSPAPFKINRAYKDPSYPMPNMSAWGVSIFSSRDMMVFGAGLYSFFRNYSQVCLVSRDCQQQILDVDRFSKVDIYSLATVSSSFQISVDGKGVVRDIDNNNGFASTVTLWRPGPHRRQQSHYELYGGGEIYEVHVEAQV
ncbi:glycoside hydrolase family 55 protein [Collybia nuda]|uniref:Glycoside hydrolase family 55 protein n=1 Tax=Collybia nuda TaxID=64659 RepID=A0A9P6CAS9_9AGAR|nr:glycoside hydrolase family 55 protein [Collybia nuda]